MTKLPTDLLIESLAAQAGPVTPLASPLRRALAAVAALGLAIGAAVLLFAFPDSIAAQAADGRGTLGFELASMAVTAALPPPLPPSNRRRIAQLMPKGSSPKTTSQAMS